MTNNSKSSQRQQLLQMRQSFQTQEAQAPSFCRIFFFEMFGIALLTLGVNNSAYAKIPDIFVASSLFVAIIFSGPFSGGHVNPAVTMGFVAKKVGLPVSAAIVYWIAQVCGGILGSLLGLATVGAVNAPVMSFQDPEYLISDLVGQSVGTFVFVFFILYVTNQKATFSSNTLNTWVVIAGALYIGRHYAIRSGGCLNPGVAIGMELVSKIISGEEQTFKRAWVYIIGPSLGGYLAGVFFEKYLKAYEKNLKDKETL